jgi:hypothetical protein
LGCTLRELDQRMSVAEFYEWAMFFARAPELARPDYRMAQLCALIANLHAKPKTTGERWSELDWLPERHLKSEEQMQYEAQLRVLRQFEMLERR